MDDDERARAAILARRRFFIASAMAGVAVGGCGDQSSPQACLKISSEQPPIEPTPSGHAPSTPGPTAQPSATVTVDDDDGAPRPCLSIRPPDLPSPTPSSTPAPTTRPRVCLRMVRPRIDDDA